MMEFLQAIVAFPTVLFTIPVGLSLLYWLFVILGAIDLDFINLDGVEGVLDGGLDGALEGAMDGVLDGALDGAVDGALDGALDGAAEGIDGALDAADAAESIGDAADGATSALRAFVGILTALNLTSVPLTVSMSFIALFGWIACYLGMQFLAPALSIPAWGLASLVFFGAFFAGTATTSFMVKPLAPLFKTELARGRRSLIGLEATITTGRVDGGFGQAEVADKGDHLIVQVRCDQGSGLSKGDKALIISFDREREAFVVESLASLLATDSAEARDRAAATAAASAATQTEKG